jgi:hypothetical protein
LSSILLQARKIEVIDIRINNLIVVFIKICIISLLTFGFSGSSFLYSKFYNKQIQLFNNTKIIMIFLKFISDFCFLILPELQSKLYISFFEFFH